ncbi:MAG: hypothetical protein KJ583_04385 [Nanoarchaeota archaeon]|nr:hypothetical protein [Nanoarchaeota archaeon]MBU1270302.1 hypothetical protein [Nanoarchaeota archaeon]MBU1604530.1 hypothetical protein [Nanoarchaeota archaeon]MBU2442865.1 hypothetical protein [Nanoarchaeota archaeon]
MKRQLIILPIIFVLMTSLALGAFDVTTTAVKKDIFLSETAEFSVTINNFEKIDDIFSFSTQDPSWVLLTQQIEVPASQNKTFLFKADPNANMALGAHAVLVKIKSLRTNEIRTELIVVNIRPYDPVFGEYRPSVQFAASINKEVDPRKKVPVEVYMRNRNALDIEEMEIFIDGKLFQDKIITTLGPQEEKRTEYLFTIHTLQEPGLYPLDVQLRVKDVTIASSRQNYEVIGYATMTIDRREKSFLFKKEEVITLENLGNAQKTTKVNLAMNWMERLFTDSDIEAKVVKTPEGITSLEWDITLNPQELKTITVTTNYRTPIILLIIIIIIVILYFVFRSPLMISKEAVVASSSEGGAEHLKIRLFVKNRTRKIVERISVIDRVPGIAELEKKKTLGTIEPEKVTKHEGKGTIIKWNLDSLEAFEERIITYEIRSKLKIIGNISLPSTRVKFLSGNRERTIYSNNVIVTN